MSETEEGKCNCIGCCGECCSTHGPKTQCECDEEEEETILPVRKSWLRRAFSWFPAMMPFLLIAGCFVHQYRHDDYTIVAKVTHKSRDDKSKNPFEPSGEIEYTIKIESIPLNDSASVNFDGLVDLWFHRIISREQFERLEKGKWYRVKIRYYPSHRMFSGVYDQYELLSIEEGPIGDPRKEPEK